MRTAASLGARPHRWTTTGMLDRTGIAKIGERLLEELIASVPGKACDHGIRATSGTTGQEPLITVATYGEAHARRFSDGTRIVLCLGSLNVRLVNMLHTRHRISDAPSRALALDARDLTAGLEDLMDDFAPDFIFGFSSFIARLSEFIRSRARRAIRIFHFSGERPMPLFLDRMRDAFPNAVARTLYSAGEFGPIGHGCPFLPINHCHPFDGVEIEVVDADETGAGDIVVSRGASESGTAIEQYRIGDVGRLYDSACRCGASVTLENLGRKGHDYIKLAGALLRREEFDRVLSSMAPEVHDYRAEAEEVLVDSAIRGKITIRIFCRDGAPDEAAIKRMAEDISGRLFLTPTRTLADLEREKLFAPLALVASASPFPAGHKNVKLSRI